MNTKKFEKVETQPEESISPSCQASSWRVQFESRHSKRGERPLAQAKKSPVSTAARTRHDFPFKLAARFHAATSSRVFA
jgi:hypothetical protein